MVKNVSTVLNSHSYIVRTMNDTNDENINRNNNKEYSKVGLCGDSLHIIQTMFISHMHPKFRYCAMSQTQ